MAIYDPMGKDATSDASAHVEQASLWFDSMWNTIAREFPL